MTDDLIQRLRTLMAEIEAKLSDTKLRDALSSLPPAYPTSALPSLAERDQDLRGSDVCTNTAKHARPNDYVPSDEGFDEASFLGTGDDDPLGHDAAIRRR